MTAQEGHRPSQPLHPRREVTAGGRIVEPKTPQPPTGPATPGPLEQRDPSETHTRGHYRHGAAGC